MSNITITRPNAPKYKIGDEVYISVSAARGFLERLIVCDISYHAAANNYVYSFNTIVVRLFENQLCSYCDALRVVVNVLQGKLTKMLELQNNKCTGYVPYVREVIYADGVAPPQPRFGAGEVVYLLETAQYSGELEAMKINSMSWDDNTKLWLYDFIINPRPEHHMSVGDADNWHHSKTVIYYESDLGVLCEAIAAAVAFLSTSYNQLSAKLASKCESSDGH